MALERTFSIIKPNAVANNDIGAIMRVLNVLVSKSSPQRCCT